jgi:hypothetical protein
MTNYRHLPYFRSDETKELDLLRAEIARLCAELDYEKQRANLMGSTERDDVVRLRAELAASERARVIAVAVQRELADAIHDKTLLIDVVYQERDAARKDAERMRHPWRSVDELDWSYLLCLLGNGGRDMFWKAVFVEARAALQQRDWCHRVAVRNQIVWC